ncbi:polysaccharide biosynthesis/export family protein [Alcanivorax sp. 1008]|nr:polysaccharide biosynthesis/export family protein [Alcanivorax sp. 1008]
MSRFYRFTLAGCLLVVLAGCTVFPGSHLKVDKPEKSDAVELSDIVRVHAIDTGLLSAEPVARPQFPEVLRQQSEVYDYLVGPGDVLNITIWGHPELTIPAGSMRSAEEAGNWVHADGTIFYPYVGKIEVAGLNVATIRDLIAQKLRRYIEDPQVDVSVAAFRSQRVYVTGAVGSPGPVPVTNVPLRLLDALIAVGDVSAEADWQRAVLTRDGKKYQLSLSSLYVDGDTRQNILLQHGDVLHLPSNKDGKVFVLGEVNKPASVVMDRNGLTLAGALADAGSIRELSANARGIFVMRAGEENGEPRIDVFQLNARSATALVLADHFQMQPRDIVYVTAAPIARWNRIISNLLPTVNALYLGVRVNEEIRDL